MQFFLYLFISNVVNTLSNQRINALVSSEFILLRFSNVQMQTKKLRERNSTGKFEHVISQLTEALVKVKSIKKSSNTRRVIKGLGEIDRVDI